MKRIILCTILATQILGQKALVVSSIADLVGQPQKKAPYNLPVAPVNYRDQISCPRLHQSIFNEVVDILEDNGLEVKIAIDNAFYQTQASNNKVNRYWAEKTHFITFDKLEELGLDLNLISNPTIVLTKPFFETKTKRTFSAGTKFVIKNNKAQIFNPLKLKFDQVTIPSKYYIKEQNRTKDEQIKLFCKLLESWATEQYIPYVWGGISFTHKSSNKFYIETDGKKQFYSLSKDAGYPKSGFDCSGVILRAAQIAGLPYYFKNTYTIGKNLSLASCSHPLPSGAIILWAGHVVVLTDANKGVIVESGDYSYGYGRLHKLPISKFFRDISSAKDLLDAYKNKKPLYRMDPNGKVVQIINEFKIYLL